MSSEELAKKIKLRAWNMGYEAKASHMSGNFSMADIIAVLYHDCINISEDDEIRDRVVLSKGHCCAVMYALLAEMGYFPKEELKTFGRNGSRLACQISYRVPGVEWSTGSLGHGISVASGIALNGKLNNKSYHVYTICGDGECDEGSVWETAMFAAHHKLDNFTVIIDANNMQAMGNIEDILKLEPLADKWQAFGWDVLEVDGHDHKAIKEAVRHQSKKMPKVIVAHTIKGKDVSFMENNLWWHYQVPFGEYYQRAIDEIKGNLI